MPQHKPQKTRACPEISTGAFSAPENCTLEFWGGPRSGSGGFQCRLLFSRSLGGRRPPSRLPASICHWTKPFSSEKKGVCLRRCGLSQKPAGSLRAVSGRETKLLVGTAQPSLPGLSPVQGPRPAGHLDRQAPHREPRVFRLETRVPAAHPSVRRRPSSPGRPPSPERPSPRPARVSSSQASTLLKPRRSPPSSISPPILILHQPRLAPPRATCTALLPSLLRPAPRPLSFLFKPWSPLPPPPRPSPPVPTQLPHLPIFTQTEASASAFPHLSFSLAQALAPPQAWGVDVCRPPRSMLRGKLPHWAPEKGPSSAFALGRAATGGLCGSGRCLGDGRRIVLRRPLR